MTWDWLKSRPLIVCIAGSNGAGKTSFFHMHVAPAVLPLVNADQLAKELDIDPYEAARTASQVRLNLVRQCESFAFETVLSDPIGDKVRFLAETAAKGYSVVMCFIGLRNVRLSRNRVRMRVMQGGHDVPRGKLIARFPRTLANLKLAIKELPHVVVFDNSDLAHPYREIAIFENGQMVKRQTPLPAWLRKVLK